MRLTSTIIAVFLALSMAIFPISMVPAAAMGGHSHTAVQAEHGPHHEGVAASKADCSTLVSADNRATPSEDAPDGRTCCGMVACHAFEISAAPTMFTPVGSAHVLQAPGDEQVTGTFSVRIDRPPRTA